MENEITNTVCATNGYDTVSEAVAHHSSVMTMGLPIHFGTAVNSLHLYVLLNIGIFLFARLFNLLDPIPRERALKKVYLGAILLFVGVVGWSVCLIVMQKHYISNELGPQSQLCKMFAAEALRQMIIVFVIPAIVFGLAGLATVALLWRRAKNALTM